MGPQDHKEWDTTETTQHACNVVKIKLFFIITDDQKCRHGHIMDIFMHGDLVSTMEWGRWTTGSNFGRGSELIFYGYFKATTFLRWLQCNLAKNGENKLF